jgi:hypothetical protein
MIKDPIKVEYSVEKFEMQSALISGKVNDYIGTPTSVYCGPLNLDEIHTALYYTNRTVIRLLVDEFGIDIDRVDEFILSALSEALTKEWNNDRTGETDIDIRKSLRKRNQ